MAFSPRSVGRLAGVAACAFTLIFVFAAPGFAQPSTPASHHAASTAQPLLPRAFAGWTATAAAQTGSSASALDPAHAAALNEFGLKDFAENTYQRGGVQMNVRALRFPDATGAYGAYTLYRQPDMRLVSVGRGGAVNAHEAVFWTGATMVDVTLPASAGDTRAALRALAARLPRVSGQDSAAPFLPRYLPMKGLDPASVRYAIGPAAYAAGGGVLPPNDINFNLDAEAVTAHYAAHGGTGVLTLLSFPTPQMAITAEKNLTALLKGTLPSTLQGSAPGALAVKRSGPLVAVTSGAFSGAEAQALLAQVKYQADVTWSRGADLELRAVHQAASMLLGIAYLTGIAVGCILILGTLIGGGRALWRISRGKPASSMYEQEFISLNLTGWHPGQPPRKMP